ncbi:MAG: hypothetical protein M5U14_02165 [Acidimicrobiia bacterium]|nr:hypothetical protein [Acidimicrobiia bacterium]
MAELIDGVAEPADLALVYPTHPATNEPLDDETVMAAIEALAAATAEVPVEVGAVGSQGVVRDPSDWSVTQPALYVGVELLGGSAPTRLSLWRSPGSSWRAYLWEVCATTEILGGEWACPEVEPAVVSPTSGPSR